MRRYSGNVQPRRNEAASLSKGPGARPQSQGGGTRIAKLMARAGLCSRREAEAWIAKGRVALNGVLLTDPAVNVNRGDKITIDGKPLVERARTRLFLFHKPRGLVTTARDPQGRATIFDYLRENWPKGPRVVSIGRLDINSEGLLLLTNDGGLARVLELPATGWIRRYRVRAKGDPSQEILDRLLDGVTVEGVTYAGIEATLDRVQGANCWLTVALREGKNREVKRVLDMIGLTVNRLIRLSYGPFQLGELAEGAVEEVRTRVLRDQLGGALAKAAGADFTSPLQADREAEETTGIPLRRAHKVALAPGTSALRRCGHDEPAQVEIRAKAKPAPRHRKHISALRAEYDTEPKTRTRIERGKTADRAGRQVQVERLVPVRSGETKQEKSRLKQRAKSPAHGARAPKEERKERAPRQGRDPAVFARLGLGARSSQKPWSPRRKT